jgi:isoleucyl-tRNA synthetase
VTAVDPPVTHYRALPPDQPPSVLEEEMLARWTDENILARTLEAREGRENFVFFEGPPTANGKPGIHHVFEVELRKVLNSLGAVRRTS